MVWIRRHQLPHEQLVVRGLYRYVRNLMYLAVLAISTGQRSVSVNDHGWGHQHVLHTRRSIAAGSPGDLGDHIMVVP
jgi:protein-S-isoprenylcysteine O-methyltransferase Ste14